MTILVSQRGWIRTMKGHVADLAGATFKGDDALMTSFFAETTSKILVLATDGKAFTLDAAKLPGGRGAGEPIRLMADLDETSAIVAVWPYAAGEKLLIATTDGRGFVVGQDDMLSSTRKGRAVMNVDAPVEVKLVTAAAGDHVATIGENRKLLVFPLNQVPEMARGKGVRLQRYKDGGISDALRVQAQRRHDLARLRRPHVHRRQVRAQGLDRHPRRSRPPAAQGLQQEQPLRRVKARAERRARRSAGR